MRSPLASLPLVVLVACGDDGGQPITDARPINMDAPVTCLATDYGEVTAPVEPYATRDADTNPSFIGYGASLNMDFDDIGIELVKEYGVFTTGEIVPVNVELTGDETNYADCGACVLLYADYNPDTDETGQIYMATGGFLDITSVSPNLTGVLRQVTLQHVTINDDTLQTTPASQCVGTITRMAFDVPVTTEKTTM